MKANRKSLVASLFSTRAGLSGKEVVEQSDTFVFDKGRVFTFNDAIAVSAPIDIKLTGAIKAQELYELLTKISTEEVEIELNESGSEILIKGGRSKAGLAVQSTITMPLDEIEAPKDWQPIPEELMEGLKTVLPSCGTNIAKPILTCIHITTDRIEASDNEQLTVYWIETGIDNLLIPASAIKELLKFSPTRYSIGNGWVHFEDGEEVIFSCRVFHEEYEDSSHLLEDFVGEKVKLPKATMAILDKAKVFSKQDLGGLSFVEVRLENNRITMKSQNSAGWFEEQARADYEGDPLTFMITPEVFMTILSEEVELTVNKDAMKFEGEKFTHIVAMLGDE